MEKHNAVKKERLFKCPDTGECHRLLILSQKSQAQMYIYCGVTLSKIQKEVRRIKGVEFGVVLTSGWDSD